MEFIQLRLDQYSIPYNKGFIFSLSLEGKQQLKDQLLDIESKLTE
jgi:hypothetical protein